MLVKAEIWGFDSWQSVIYGWGCV